MKKPILAKLLPALALASLGSDSTPQPTSQPVICRNRPGPGSIAGQDRIRAAAEKRARKAAKLEALADKGAIRRFGA